MAARFQALAAPSRLRVLDTLMQGPLGLGALAARAGLSLSNASRQVAALEQAGCVQRRREGRELTVAIADPTLVELCALVCGAIARRAQHEQAALGQRTRR
ncbi:MAG: ArsR/SmtB family transcription factor [Planctomycetia bacterium]